MKWRHLLGDGQCVPAATAMLGFIILHCTGCLTDVDTNSDYIVNHRPILSLAKFFIHKAKFVKTQTLFKIFLTEVELNVIVH